MKTPTYYSKRLNDLELEYDQYTNDDDHAKATAATNSIKKLKRELKRELRKMLSEGADPNDEATSTTRYHDANKRYNEYYAANWVLLFAMLGVGGGAYFRKNSI